MKNVCDGQKKLLRDTEMSLEQISEALNQTVCNVRKQFKRLTGMTPQNYREVFLARASWPSQARKPNKDELSICFLSGLKHHAAREILFGVEQYARAHGNLRISLNEGFNSSTLDPEVELIRHELLQTYDGLIALPDAQIPASLLTSKPIVCVEHLRNSPNSVAVTLNNTDIGSSAAKHFLNKGYTEFAYCEFEATDAALGDGYIDPRSQGRYNGFRQELLKQGIDPNSIRRQIYTGHVGLSQWLTQLPRHTAIFTFSDQLALFIIVACKRLGIHVPEELAVLGVDNDELYEQCTRPAISSMEIDFRMMGSTALQRLVQMLAETQRPASKNQSFIPSLCVEKESTQGLATDNEVVNRAVRQMRKHLDRNISITELAEESTVSRRTLEMQFKAVLGCPPKAYLELLRIEKTQRLLIQSNHTVEEIADRVGIQPGTYLTQVFRKRTGQTPNRYRRAWHA